ncbi:hypothetical protein CDAR_220171 [Caerostris darwini]|uniref:Uncharacterized protein n=1 Tax=Caerostris darwini TaxID=1538125 RepID=A0AAV4VHX7_9ARAC|nr:hypothetical protein CDAR_220171 [Caerostris darwini]
MLRNALATQTRHLRIFSSQLICCNQRAHVLFLKKKQEKSKLEVQDTAERGRHLHAEDKHSFHQVYLHSTRVPCTCAMPTSSKRNLAMNLDGLH